MPSPALDYWLVVWFSPFSTHGFLRLLQQSSQQTCSVKGQVANRLKVSRLYSVCPGEGTHSGILSWKIPWAKRAWWATVHGVATSWTRLSNWAPTVSITATYSAIVAGSQLQHRPDTNEWVWLVYNKTLFTKIIWNGRFKEEGVCVYM